MCPQFYDVSQQREFEEHVQKHFDESEVGFKNNEQLNYF